MGACRSDVWHPFAEEWREVCYHFHRTKCVAFSSGSFDLLNELADGTKVDNPLAAAGRVGANHPYAKLDGKFAYYVREAKQLFLDCGIEVNGDAERNHLRITPMGTLKPTWLTFSDFTQLSSPHDIAGKKVLVVNIAGFLDFNTKFVADSFEKCGAECRISSINLPELERLRISPTEMRSTNIARVLENDKTLETLIRSWPERYPALTALLCRLYSDCRLPHR